MIAIYAFNLGIVPGCLAGYLLARDIVKPLLIPTTVLTAAEVLDACLHGSITDCTQDVIEALLAAAAADPNIAVYDDIQQLCKDEGWECPEL